MMLSTKLLPVWMASALMMMMMNEGAASVTFMTPGRPESVVTADNAFFVGQLAPEGGSILKYDLDGNPDAAFTAPELFNIRGLAINQASDTLWAAHDGAVAELVLNEDQTTLTLQQLYNVSSVMSEPNALCLAPDEMSLYVTDPSSHSLVQIDVASQNWNLLVNSTQWTPHGCSVSHDNEVVWMVHRNGVGITKYQISTGEMGATEAFSQPIAALTTMPNTVADGMVLWEDKLFVSVWVLGPPFNGTVFECDLTTTCTEWASGVAAADLQLDSKTPDQPQLILPSLVQQQVTTMSLLPPDEVTTAPVETTAPAPSAAAEEEEGEETPKAEEPDASSSMQKHGISFGVLATTGLVAFLECLSM